MKTPLTANTQTFAQKVMDAMASDNLDEGIRQSKADTRKFEQFARTKVENMMATA